MLIRKQYLEKIRRFYESNLIKVLTGVRRCGKSVLLNQIKDELINENGIEENHIISINFEDVQFAHISTFNQLNDFILTQIKDEGKYYIFLDEIQYVKEFEKTLASLKATKNVSLFVTGSNSKLLSGRLASLLVGRCKEFKIMPFTYSELMEYYQEKGLEMPNKPLQDFIKFGGMPQRLDYS
nr:AAA family ATPase [Bacilli bacterium]